MWWKIGFTLALAGILLHLAVDFLESSVADEKLHNLRPRLQEACEQRHEAEDMTEKLVQEWKQLNTQYIASLSEKNPDEAQKVWPQLQSKTDALEATKQVLRRRIEHEADVRSAVEAWEHLYRATALVLTVRNQLNELAE